MIKAEDQAYSIPASSRAHTRSRQAERKRKNPGKSILCSVPLANGDCWLGFSWKGKFLGIAIRMRTSANTPIGTLYRRSLAKISAGSSTCILDQEDPSPYILITDGTTDYRPEQKG